MRSLAGAPIGELFEEGPDDRVHVDPRMELPELHLGGAVVAPLIVRGERVGSLAAFYARGRRIRPEDTRVVGDAAQLVSAQLELAAVEEQEERLARAELRALRAQISPHFVYNALAAVASYIHSRPEEARELLTDFAEFTRYAFRRERPYVHARRRAALRREVPQPGAGPLRRAAARAPGGGARDPAGGGAGAVAAAARGERGPPRHGRGRPARPCTSRSSARTSAPTRW